MASWAEAVRVLVGLPLHQGDGFGDHFGVEGVCCALLIRSVSFPCQTFEHGM
ncbi:hypothetical protein [Streptomyces sp. NBC_01268]|uniref:hypothetical protein n=1 Tax=Streptomyces sp. NBC_01268 TaxID=2903806 RepID=UPI002E3471CB|nr:hypothetical protein [Streptomyces sp. NBC_01268]